MSERLPKRLAGHLLLEQLGKGGAGAAYLAKPRPDLEISAPFVVVKCLREELADDPQVLSRFRHEAELAVQVASSNLVEVYEAGAAGNTYYLVLEHVPGWTYFELIQESLGREKLLPLDICGALIAGVLEGLSDLHLARDEDGRPLSAIHRDLAPKNLMLRADGTVKIIDLGIGTSSLREWATKTGLMLGSPGYMAPEQVRAEGMDERCDLYTTGEVAFELFTLRPWVPKAPTLEMLASALTARDPAICELRKELPREADAWIERALAFDPADRFSSADAMREALETWAPIADSARLASYFTALLGRKLELQRERVRAWIDAEPTLEGEVARTELFARRDPAARSASSPVSDSATSSASSPVFDSATSSASSPATVPTFVPPLPPPPPPRARRAAGAPRMLLALLLLATVIASVAATVWVMRSNEIAVAPVQAPVAPEQPAASNVAAVEAVRAEPRAMAIEDEPRDAPDPRRLARETSPRRAKVDPRRTPAVDTPLDTPLVKPAADPRARFELLRERAAQMRAAMPEGAERKRVLELELDLAGARAIEDAERLDRVLDKIERELGGLSR